MADPIGIGIIGAGGISHSHLIAFTKSRTNRDLARVVAIADIDEAVNYPDDKADGAQIHAHELIDVGALHFDGNLFSSSREYSLVDLAKRGGGSGFTLQRRIPTNI